MKDLPKRTLTAIVFGAVMIGGIVIHPYLFFALLLFIHTGCLWEYFSLVSVLQDYRDNQRSRIKALLILVSTIIFFLLCATIGLLDFIQDVYYFLVVPLLLLFLIIELFTGSRQPIRNAALNLAGAFYISFPLSMLVFFVQVDQSANWFPDRSGLILGMILLVWVHDTFAYFIGSRFGKHKMLPAISPKKSWEGFMGGLVFCILTGLLLSNYFHQLDSKGWSIVALIVSVFGTLGDFVESMIKRSAGAKDSGNILPGHGGFLDRFDAFIFSIPFVFFFCLIYIAA